MANKTKQNKNDLDKPDIARTIKDNDLSPVDMYKCALMRFSWNTSAVNHRSMLLKKVSDNTKCQLRNCASILNIALFWLCKNALSTNVLGNKTQCQLFFGK